MSLIMTFLDKHIINFDFIHLSYLSGKELGILSFYPTIEQILSLH